ncbi:hypothetical protein ACMAZD_05855 [Vibrio sp. nBUS_14]|uniref:hypothetical protein n=1 Tax=Vibrio sp. nBUS_14 TaxID=3395321 RepID=UPI003EBC2D49
MSNEPPEETTYKNKTLHYRKAQFADYDEAYTLEELLIKASRNFEKVGQRFMTVDTDDTDASEDEPSKSKLFLNHSTIRWGIFFSDLLKYSDDTNMNVVTLDDDAKFLDVEQIAPASTKDGKKREFLESVLYVGVFKNHLAIIQSASLRTRDLEKYLDWYLKSSGVMKKGYVILSSEVPKEVKNQIANNNTKSVKVGAPLIENLDNEPVKKYRELESFDTKSVKLNPSGPGLDMVKSMLSAFGNTDLLDKFNLSQELLAQDALDGSDIKVSLELTYKRKASNKSREILNTISTAFRHAHPDDVEVEIDNVGKLTGDKLNIRKTLNIRYFNGILDPEDLYLKMRDWMKDQIELDEIEAEM